MKQVLIHMKPEALDIIQEKGLSFDYSPQFPDELEVIVTDVDYKDGNHPDMNGIWQDPDIQLCDYYGIDYNLVNCIEAI